MKSKLVEGTLKYDGKTHEIEFPEYHFKNFKIRISKEDDLEAISNVNYPGMAIDITDENFLKKFHQGLVFNKETNGFIFVVVENDKGEIVGRSYIKSWHVDYFQKPRYALRKNSVLLVDASHSFSGKKIIEIGGVVVKPEYQGQGLGSALLYARLLLIDYIRNDLHLQMHSIMITNIGPFRSQDNLDKISYRQRLVDHLVKEGVLKDDSIESIEKLSDVGKVMDLETFYGLVDGLKVVNYQNRIKTCAPYYFGAAREASYHAYTNSKRLCFGEPIFVDEGASYSSPFIFRQSECIHFEHGGSYFIHNFV